MLLRALLSILRSSGRSLIEGGMEWQFGGGRCLLLSCSLWLSNGME